jgi:hypothetical protein
MAFSQLRKNRSNTNNPAYYNIFKELGLLRNTYIKHEIVGRNKKSNTVFGLSTSDLIYSQFMHDYMLNRDNPRF